MLPIAMSGGPSQSSSLKEARPALHLRTALFVENLPLEVGVFELEKLYGEVGHVKHCHFFFRWRNGELKRFGFVLMDTNDDALGAIKTLDRMMYGESVMRVQFWRSDDYPRSHFGSPILYVWNLPHASTEREVMHHVSKCLRRKGLGEDYYPYDITFCFDAPRRRFTGCAYLRFRKHHHAEIACQYCSGSVIGGRVIEVKFPC